MEVARHLEAGGTGEGTSPRWVGIHNFIEAELAFAMSFRPDKGPKADGRVLDRCLHDAVLRFGADTQNHKGTRTWSRSMAPSATGGGQILRTSLALSMCIGQPFTLTKVRACRAKPGLMRVEPHLRERGHRDVRD